MKKIFLIFTLLMSLPLYAQNFQIHYDTGHDRKYFTTTLELFKPDEYGSTYTFVDMDYNQPGNKSVSLGYYEIARYINIPWIKDISATVQYNDGTAPWGRLGQVWLFGLSHPFDLGFVTLNTDFLYRKDYNSSHGVDGQLTSVWYKSLFDGKVEISGFIDIWSQDIAQNPNNKKEIVVMTQPQFWYYLNRHLGLGSEIDISRNFKNSGSNIWYAQPTIAMKWIF